MKKLSQYGVEEGLVIIGNIIVPIAEIALDKEAVKLFKKDKPNEGETLLQASARKLKASVPALVKNHSSELIEILAAFEQCEPNEYVENKNLALLVKDMYLLFNDEDVIQLFDSAQTNEQEEPSGSVQESTEGVVLKVL